MKYIPAKPDRAETWLDCGALGERDVEVVYWYEPGMPAKLYGRPEDCYPEEPEFVEITEVWLKIGGKPVDVYDMIDNDSMAFLSERVLELARDNRTSYLTDMAGARYDAWKDSQLDKEF